MPQNPTQGVQSTERQEITQAIKGIDFPASREEIVTQARQNKAPQNIIGRLNKLPDEEFTSLARVLDLAGR